jgi:glycosyltransferase involved in cell wall biosynthesis
LRRADIIVALVASPLVAFLETAVPIIYISDTTFAQISRAYPRYRRFPAWLKRDGERVERRALAKASLAVYPCEWARDSAVGDYGVREGATLVTPFGPNLPSAVLEPRPSPKMPPTGGVLRILHVSMDWERKGGDIVVETARLLNRRGVPARAVLVGQVPRPVRSDPVVDHVGLLDKTDPRDAARLVSLYRDCHVFMLPTVADCYAVVFSEAQALGCPCLTYDVGGTSEAMRDGRCGAVLPPGAGPEAFAERIEAMIGDPDAYSAIAVACRDNFEAYANWTVFVRTIMDRTGSILADA